MFSRPWIVGIALVAMGAGLAFVASGFERGAGARVAGDNAPVNASARAAGDISAHNSPTLVSNPRNPTNLVVANKIDSPRFSCALHVSFDAGVHWSQTPIPLPAGEEPKCYAPDVAFGANGTLYVSFVTLAGRGNVPHAVWLVRSTDGGQTLTDPQRVQGELKFQVRLAADPRASRRLYMTWLDVGEVGLFRFAETGNPIKAARSDDGGRTWATPATVSPATRERALAPTPLVGAAGELLVLYLDLGDDSLDYEGAHHGRGGPPYDGKWQLVLARSIDRGASWEESTVDELVPTERFIAFTPPFPSLAVDRDSGSLYAAFHDGRRGNPDVYLWRLQRDASSWSKALKVNNTPDSNSTAQLLPKLSVAPDGRLDVLYYDRRSDPRDDVMTEASLQSSYDGGASFLARLRLSDKRFDSRIGYGSERRMPDLGSRLGLISTDARALAVWTDTRVSTLTSGKQDLARGLAAFRAPEDISTTLKTLLRIVGVLLALAGIGLIVSAAGLRARRDGDGDGPSERSRPAPRTRQRV